MKLLLFALVLFANFQNETSPVQQYTIYSESLCIGDHMSFGNRTLKFREIIGDSRCPEAPIITCIWAGEVKILVDIFENGKLKGTKEITGTTSIAGLFQNVKNLNLSVVSVYPKKITPENIPAGDYRVKFKIMEQIDF